MLRATPTRLLLVASALIAVACSPDAGDSGAATTAAATDSTLSSTVVSETTASPTTTRAPLPVVDRLAILDGDGNVATIDPDGSNVRQHTRDASSGVTYFQPTWGPGSSVIAVSRLESTAASIVALPGSGEAGRSLDVESNAFYVYWSADTGRLAYLSNSSTGLNLAIAEFGDEVTSRVVDTGAPLYFSWEPEGSGLATLIGQRRFELRDVTDPEEPSELASPGAFQNPVWTDAGLLYVAREGGTDYLYIGDPAGESRRLAIAAAPLIMTAPRSGARVAVQTAGDIDGVSAALQSVEQLPLNRLVVVDTATGEFTEVTSEPALAFFWDPAGAQLLILDTAPESRRLRWRIWSDDSLIDVAEFFPAQTFVDSFLPFFGQYALSTTMWAPDGSAFAFAGLVGDEAGVFVQSVTGGAPRKVADGTWVTWSWN